MILISHRGNINGRIESSENEPSYVDSTISKGYDVEIDVWLKDGDLWLGHDKPQYKTNLDWIQNRSSKLWVHCKNLESITFFNDLNDGQINYFWHQNDDVTLTSKNYIWAFPGKQPIKNSIAVLPELYNDHVSFCLGVCSDYIENYKIKNN
jgi:hypothetical protein